MHSYTWIRLNWILLRKLVLQEHLAMPINVCHRPQPVCLAVRFLDEARNRKGTVSSLTLKLAMLFLPRASGKFICMNCNWYLSKLLILFVQNKCLTSPVNFCIAQETSGIASGALFEIENAKNIIAKLFFLYRMHQQEAWQTFSILCKFVKMFLKRIISHKSENLAVACFWMRILSWPCSEILSLSGHDCPCLGLTWFSMSGDLKTHMPELQNKTC